MEAFVYKWTNINSGEYYIGVHKGTIDDGYIGSGKKFRAKYNKYPDLFERIIICECQTYEKALKIEKQLVTKDIIINDKLCLNLKPGGEGGGAPGWASNIDFEKRCNIRKENARRKGISYGQHRIGKKWSNNIKEKFSQRAKNRKHIECPYCLKTGPIPQMKQWHFNNCKGNVYGKIN